MNYFKKNQSFLVQYFIYWENRKQYLELMERFSNGKINGTQFDREFSKMWQADTDEMWRADTDEMWGVETDKNYRFKKFLDNINDLELTKLEGFSDLLSNLFTDCDVFQPDPDLRDYYEISEEELRDCVKKTILKIQEYF